MGFGNSDFKTKSSRFVVGFGLVINLNEDLPRKYDEGRMGAADSKGYVMVGHVVSVFGALDPAAAPVVGSDVSVTVRPGDGRKEIFDDLEKTKEGACFFLEGVTGDVDALCARWVHGAGSNRDIRALEIVGAPHVSFENPIPADGPSSGYLRVNLDGSPTVFSERRLDGVWGTREFSFEEVVSRLGVALEKNLKFSVRQRVLAPSAALRVHNQGELEEVLTAFREEGFTGSVVRSFVPGVLDSDHVDVQALLWPQDIPGKGGAADRTYEMPVLQDTPRFVALRDGEADAHMEVIPGYVMDLIGNSNDIEKSTKHKFVGTIVKGLSNGQKALYAGQQYGPGIAISSINGDGDVTGLLRLATRTEGAQYRSLVTIPTPNFQDAGQVVMAVKNKSADAAAEG